MSADSKGLGGADSHNIEPLGKVMQRKATAQSRGPNAAESRLLGIVKELPCICCGAPGPSIIDHIYGSSKKLYCGIERVHVGHMAVLPLCYSCDYIKTHRSRRVFEEQFGQQEQLWFNMLNKHSLTEMVPENVRQAIAGEILPW